MSTMTQPSSRAWRSASAGSSSGRSVMEVSVASHYARLMWRNWAGDQHCSPWAIEQPMSITGVQDVVRRAAAAGRTVRAVGSGHSFTDAALTNGHMLSLGRMDHVLDVDRDAGVVRVEAGITINRLSNELAQHGLAL